MAVEHLTYCQLHPCNKNIQTTLCPPINLAVIRPIQRFDTNNLTTKNLFKNLSKQREPNSKTYFSAEFALLLQSVIRCETKNLLEK